MNNVPKSAEIDDLEIFGESSLHLADMTLLDYENNFVDTLIPGKGYWTIINATTNVFYVPSEADYHEGEL